MESEFAPIPCLCPLPLSPKGGCWTLQTSSCHTELVEVCVEGKWRVGFGLWVTETILCIVILSLSKYVQEEIAGGDQGM